MCPSIILASTNTTLSFSRRARRCSSMELQQQQQQPGLRSQQIPIYNTIIRLSAERAYEFNGLQWGEFGGQVCAQAGANIIGRDRWPFERERANKHARRAVLLFAILSCLSVYLHPWAAFGRRQSRAIEQQMQAALAKAVAKANANSSRELVRFPQTKKHHLLTQIPNPCPLPANYCSMPESPTHLALSSRYALLLVPHLALKLPRQPRAHRAQSQSEIGFVIQL